ncbi:MAG: alkaline phosphatase family protein [Methylocella sp.]
MGTEDLQRKSLKRRLLSCVAAIALIGNTMAPFSTAVAQESPTLTPIKHVIVIIGENRSFDHVFATYKPVNKGEKVLNLLSKQIVKADGSPGPNYGEALQYQSFDTSTYHLNPPKTPYANLPPALVGGTSTPYGCEVLGGCPDHC